jgi:hypothetical protein
MACIRDVRLQPSDNLTLRTDVDLQRKLDHLLCPAVQAKCARSRSFISLQCELVGSTDQIHQEKVIIFVINFYEEKISPAYHFFSISGGS